MKPATIIAALLSALVLTLTLSAGEDLRAQDPEEALSPTVPVTTPAMMRVAAALAWLADHQSDGGYWNPEYFHEDSLRKGVEAVVDGRTGKNPNANGLSLSAKREALGAGRLESAEMTAAAAMLAFVGTGSNLEKGPFANNVRRGTAWLVSRQDSDGCLSRRKNMRGADNEVWSYNHAMATIALAEIEIASPSEFVKGALERAVAFLRSSADSASKGWKSASGVDGILASLNALALAKANEAKVDAAFKGGFDKTLDDWLLSRESGKEQSYVASNGSNSSTLIPNGYGNLKMATAMSLAARLAIGKLSAADARARTQAGLLHASGQNGADEPFFMAFALPTADRASHLDTVRWVNLVYPRLREAQRGYRSDEVGAFEGAGSSRGRIFLDEHGSWDPQGIWAEMGGRPMATAFNAMALTTCAAMKREKTDLSSIKTGAGSKLVPWDGKLVGLEGKSEKELIASFWKAMVAGARKLVGEETYEHYALKDGQVVADSVIFINAIIEVTDTATMTKGDGGEPAVQYTLLLDSGDQTCYYLPLRGEEWHKPKGSDVYVRNHDEAHKNAKRGKASALVGPKDPRFSWNEPVWGWYNNLHPDKISWAERCGAALWYHQQYPRYQWALSDDPGHAVWNGYAEEILLGAQNFGGVPDDFSTYVASYMRQNPQLAKSGTYFYLDTYLTPDQLKIRQNLQSDQGSFISWFDAYYVKRRANQSKAVLAKPAVTKLRDECRAERASIIDSIRKRVLVGE